MKWKHQDFQGRADDLYAAVQFLKHHKAIDPDRIGIIGHSQGGYIVPMTACQHKDVAFFISLVGPTRVVWEQMEDDYKNSFRCQGFTGQELEEKVESFMKWARLEANLGKVIRLGEMRHSAGINDYDPRQALQTVESPGILVFAENDGIDLKNESWLQLGSRFALIISGVTFVVVYLQLIRGKQIQSKNLRFFLWVVVFALMNSFTEEMITRFSIVALLDNLIPLSYVYLISALIFGTVHYFGMPGKIPGVLMAGFLGWFLAKSIGETPGFFWAWLIHCLQDVIIFTGLFFQQFSQNEKMTNEPAVID